LKLKSEKILVFVLLIIVIIFLVISLKYESTARLLPLVIGIPTLFLLFFQLLLETIPSFSKLKKNIESTNVFKKQEILQDKKLNKEENIKRKNKKLKDEKNILLWIAFLIITIWLIGFIIAIPIFLILFFSLNNIFKLHKSILISLVTSAIVYFLFDKLLNLTLYKGLLGLF